MTDVPATKRAHLPPLIHLGGRAVFVLAATILLAFGAASGSLLLRAWQEQGEVVQRAITFAASTSDDLDHEIEATKRLLMVLSTSPALKTGDLRSFYDQLMETPKPDGAWLTLWDEERQLLNTLRPYGSALPLISDYAHGRAIRESIRESKTGLVISNRFREPLATVDAVPLHLRIDGANGEMRGILTAMLSGPQLDLVVERQRMPPGWGSMILDRNGKVIATTDASALSSSDQVSGRVLIKSGHSTEGFLRTERNSALPTGRAFSKSAVTGFTAVTTLPPSALQAPFDRAFAQIGLAALALSLASALAFAVVSREAAIPIDEMTARVKTKDTDLRVANAHLRTVLAGISDCYLTLDDEFRIREISQAALKWLRLDYADALGMSLWEFVSPGDEASRASRRAMAERRPIHLELSSVLDPGRWLDFRIYPSAAGISIFFRDITERRQAQRKVEETKELLQSSLDAIAAPLVVLDEDGDIVFSNQAWESWTQETSAPDAGLAELRPCFWSRIGAIVDDGIGQNIVASLRDLLAGTHRPVRLSFTSKGSSHHLRAAPFRMDGETRAVIVIEDVTEITSARDEIEQLSNSLLTLQESERRRIAVELHDSTAQHLVAVALNFMRLKQLIDTKDAERICGEIESSIDEALKEIRSFSYLLHPPNLEDDGLESSLRSFAEGFSQRTGLATTLRWEGDAENLPFEVQRSLLRVVQEALMNVHRHAAASHIWIDARADGASFRVRILDDGRGIAVSGASRDFAPKLALGVGIPGMRSRLKQIGGDLIIRTSRQGTVVTASVPFAGVEG